MAVPQHIHYGYRGPFLAFLSLYQYVALIDIVPIQKKITNEPPQTEIHHGEDRLMHHSNFNQPIHFTEKLFLKKFIYL